jgi:hypothetical protein
MKAGYSNLTYCVTEPLTCGNTDAALARKQAVLEGLLILVEALGGSHGKWKEARRSAKARENSESCGKMRRQRSSYGL